MDNDYLRVNSKSDDEEIVTEEYDITKEQVHVEEQQKLTVMGILFSGKKKNGKQVSVPLPTFKGSFTVFLIMSFVAVFLLFIALVTKTAEFFIIDALLISVLFPLSAIAFFNDLNTKKNVRLSEIICAVASGMFAYLLIGFINNYIISLLSDLKAVGTVITTIFTDAFLFFLAYIYIKLIKKDDMFAAILICVSIYAGYLVMYTADSLIDSLCVSVTVFSGELRAIVFNGETNEFGRSANAFVRSIVSDGIHYPMLSIFWATICAGVIGLTTMPIREIREHRATYALFLLIQIVLHVVSNFTSTLRFYNVLISSLCLIFSLFCAIRMLNYALSKTNLLISTEAENVS